MKFKLTKTNKLIALTGAIAAIIIVWGGVFMIKEESLNNDYFLNKSDTIAKQSDKLRKQVENQSLKEDIRFKKEEAPNGKYSVIVTRKDIPIWYRFQEAGDGPYVIEEFNLFFVNLITGDKKEFEIYDLAPKELLDPIKQIPATETYILDPTLLGWSADSNEFWGTTNIYWGGSDNPTPEAASLFKIDINTWNVERFMVPAQSIEWLEKQDFNVERKLILVETITQKEELFLYLYDILKNKKTVIVSYPKTTLTKYLPVKYIDSAYFNPYLFQIESRSLNAKWIDSGSISYQDFVTREVIVKKIQ